MKIGGQISNPFALNDVNKNCCGDTLYRFEINLFIFILWWQQQKALFNWGLLHAMELISQYSH